MSGREISYRQSETWRNSERLLLTQVGCPWCRTVYPVYAVDQMTGQPITNIPFADTSRYSSLAIFYSQLANSDPVRREVAKDGPLDGLIPRDAGCRQLHLPGRRYFRSSTSTATRRRPGRRRSSPSGCPGRSLAYLVRSQKAAKVPAKQRVLVQVSSQPGKPTLAQGRRLTVPIVVFLTVLIATLGLAFILENLRPRIRPLPAALEQHDTERAAAAGGQNRQQ